MRQQGTLRVALVCALILFGASSARAQVVDTTKKGPEPDSTLMTSAMIDAGRKVFHGKGNCYACHGDKLQGGPVAPSLVGPNWRHIDGTFDGIVNRIDEGMPGTVMVPHPGGITESQTYIVATYIFAVSHGKAKP